MKKHIIILVLRILESESDEQHPLTQTEIANIISEVYPCDRKTVCRNIKFLKEMGYPIIKTTKGFYMNNKSISAAEIEIVKTAILKIEGTLLHDKEALAARVVDALTKRYSQ